MRTQALYRLWLERAQEDPELHEELSGLNPEKDADAINDRFYRDLEFGTGGLRGVIGAGTNRMNIYVIRRATQGLCAYLKAAKLPGKVARRFSGISGLPGYLMNCWKWLIRRKSVWCRALIYRFLQSRHRNGCRLSWKKPEQIFPLSNQQN